MFPCEICAKEFARRDVLRRHIRCVHGQKQYRCKICTEEFARKEDLRRPVRSFYGGKQYQCNICVTEFTRKDNLTRHICCVHDGTEFKECICQSLRVHATPTECPCMNPPSAKKLKRTDPTKSSDTSST